MKFEQRSLKEAVGAILAHNISSHTGKRVLRKGTLIGVEETKLLRELGRMSIYVAELEQGDIGEAQAAQVIAECVSGEHVRLVGAVTGRTNLVAQRAGILRIDVNKLNAINELDGITLSTLYNNSVVPERQTLASIKIIPYGLPADTIEDVKAITEDDPIITLALLEPKRVHLLLLGGTPILEKLERDFRGPLEKRVETLGSTINGVHKIATDVDDPIAMIVAGLEHLPESEVDLLIIAGETAIMDHRDIIPTAIKLAGGHVEVTGAPVDPGNLLMLAYLGELPILGAPGCARSQKENVVDWVLPRLLSGEQLVRGDITKLGHGGLLDDIKERPFPRSDAGKVQDA